MGTSAPGEGGGLKESSVTIGEGISENLLAAETINRQLTAILAVIEHEDSPITGDAVSTSLSYRDTLTATNKELHRAQSHIVKLASIVVGEIPGV